MSAAISDHVYQEASVVFHHRCTARAMQHVGWGRGVAMELCWNWCFYSTLSTSTSVDACEPTACALAEDGIYTCAHATLDALQIPQPVPADHKGAKAPTL